LPPGPVATARAAQVPGALQHPLAQSASAAHAPVMNCVPVDAGADATAVGGAAAAGTRVSGRARLSWRGGSPEPAAEDATAFAVAFPDARTPAFELSTPGAAALEPSLSVARLFGATSPNPHPPSRSCAMTGPAHLPEWKPQQDDAQSASALQVPVMNCVPAASGVEAAEVGAVGWHERAGVCGSAERLTGSGCRDARGGHAGDSSRGRRRRRGPGARDALAGLGVVDAGRGLVRAGLERGDVVRRDVAEPAPAVALLRDDRPGALAGVEAAAGGRAVDVGRACAGDELAAGREAWEDGGGREERGWAKVSMKGPCARPCACVPLARRRMRRASMMSDE
jgi:hypothetical protein